MDLTVETVQGPGRLVVAEATGAPSTVLLLGHGAGGGVEAFDLRALADVLPAAGVTVVRYSQPWREAGRKVAVSPPRLDEAWAPAVEAVATRWPSVPLVVGGRSAGARIACRWAATHEVMGVVALSFPLHPPGRPEASRVDELAGARAPLLVVQGESDPFGRPDEIREAIAAADHAGDRTLVEVPGARHGLEPHRVGDDPATRVAAIVDPVREFLTRVG